ncbi:hypothetical protein J4558_26930 [Leptolyngbya sp. 15MV]|nr:hypothetical protein J4558_26930 [Leptolyngbya sp. 15MV]
MAGTHFYWTGDTDMNCLRHALRSVLDHAYGHHIERLMITGNFALIAGVHPRAISDWYLGMYADAVDWATLPNTLGMAMHADARRNSTQGVVGTKPYCASGRYVQRMSNYCSGCAYDPARRTGDRACPITTFYWDFLLRHEPTFARNPRMTMMMKHVTSLTPAQRVEITVHARALRSRLGIDPAAAHPHPPHNVARSLWEAR